MRRASAVGLLGILLLAAAASAEAQSGGLGAVEALVREGRAEEARALLLRWWDEDQSEASRDDLQRALWLRGRLTVDPAQAILDFQRLAVLYPAGPFADQALLRLVQGAHAMGDAQGVTRHLEALKRDHPRSEATREAERFLASAGPLPPQGRGGVDGQVDGGASAASSSAAFSVQLGAFGERGRAQAIFEEAREAGFEARLVRVEGSQLLHVRVGRFRERPGAEAVLERLRQEGLGGAVVRDERPERAEAP